jgi:hypothetical protein
MQTQAAAFLRPPDGADVVYEFFAPFAHIPGRYEWCRIRSPTHGVFDTFIALGESTSVPATVYVNSVLGQSFMRDRYPECQTVRVAPGDLRIDESADGRTVTGTLKVPDGPVREAAMTLRAPPTTLPQAVPYGGEGKPVWGSRFTCWGVDLNVQGACDGFLVRADGKRETFRGTPCIVSLGSFGRIAPLP